MSMNSLLPELLQPIFSRVSNLGSLDKLLKASPTALGHFNNHGANIFEAILSSREIHEQTCALIRITALLRSSALPPQVRDLTSFTDLVRHESTSHRYNPPAWTHLPTRLSSAVPASMLLDILATQRKIECLVTSCVGFYLKRFNALRPRHLADPSFSFRGKWHGEGLDRHYIAGWELKPEETSFPVHDIGPPSWLEEQRVLRAFWRVQLFRDLKAAASDSKIAWPKADLERLDHMSVVDLHDWHRDVVCEETDRFVDDSQEPCIILDEDTEPMLYQQDTLLENELVWSVEEYAMEDAQNIAAPDFLQTRRVWPPPVEGDNDWEYLSYHNSATHAFFHDVGGNENSHHFSGASPLQHVSFEPFRRLGFAIWCIERMNNYGFLRPVGTWEPVEEYIKYSSTDRHFTRNSAFNAWRSILGNYELAKVARKSQEWVDEANRAKREREC